MNLMMDTSNYLLEPVLVSDKKCLYKNYVYKLLNPNTKSHKMPKNCRKLIKMRVFRITMVTMVTNIYFLKHVNRNLPIVITIKSVKFEKKIPTITCQNVVKTGNL